MQKNVAGQKIGSQMVSATDGSAFSGAVTVYVTGDAGTQAIGSVGSGVCTHEGNGYHTYAPSQAETNYDLIAFTFIGTGAVPVTVQVFTAINPVTAVPTAAQNATQVRSELATELGRIDAAVSTRATQTSVDMIDDFLDTEVAAIKAKTDNLPSDPADASVIAASFEEIKGTGWSSSTDTLKLIKAATGTASVTVLPLSATDPQRVTGTRISVPMFDRTPIRMPVYDVNDDPVDLTALSPFQLRVVIESQQQVDVQIVEHADISVDGGDNNYFTFQPSVGVVSKPANYKWALLHVVSDSPKDNRKKAGGEFVVEYSPGKD